VEAAPLRFVQARGHEDPLTLLGELGQSRYLVWYLADLGAKSAVVEPNYFDRDYLSEFAAFYCTSSAGYSNCCERAHYFATDVDRELLERAAGGDSAAYGLLQDSYLGFVVKRPIPGTPLGRTVLRWYVDDTPQLPRVVDPSRDYAVHLAGIELNVRGLAWQQQDAGVGACATVALWSMLHSSAFDDRHVVPTTAEVTQTAHRAGLSAQPLYPSRGLSFGQLIASVRDSGFAPLVVAGEQEHSRFKREHFCPSLASFIRSGYPVLVAGDLEGGNGLHAVCAVGFRQAASLDVAAGNVELEDTRTEYLYLHDDNLGPAARFRVEVDPGSEQVFLKTAPPAKRHSLELVDPTEGYPRFIPTALLAAAHNDVRITPDRLHSLALNLGTMIVSATGNAIGLTASSRIARLSNYLGQELSRVFSGNSALLARTRLALVETVAPMSLHLGVVRIGTGHAPLLDVLYDTTDSVPNMRAFCYVAYHPNMAHVVQQLIAFKLVSLGVEVAGF